MSLFASDVILSPDSEIITLRPGEPTPELDRVQVDLTAQVYSMCSGFFELPEFEVSLITTPD